MKKEFGFVLAAAILLAGCGQKKETTTTTARPVKTTIVESRSIIRKDFSGIVEAVEYVKLAFRVNGQIIQLPVIEGQKVKKGQLIAAIDPRDIALQYAATKSAYETASAQVERNKRLLSRQAISVQEYEISLANFQKAKSEYELSANNMRDTKLTAPFDGSIEKRLVENYQRVNSGEGIVQLVNTHNLRIKFTIPDAYLYLLRAKDPRFLVEFDTFKGHVFQAKLEEYLDISTDGTGIPVSIRYPGTGKEKRSLVFFYVDDQTVIIFGSGKPVVRDIGFEIQFTGQIQKLILELGISLHVCLIPLIKPGNT